MGLVELLNMIVMFPNDHVREGSVYRKLLFEL